MDDHYCPICGELHGGGELAHDEPDGDETDDGAGGEGIAAPGHWAAMPSPPAEETEQVEAQAEAAVAIAEAQAEAAVAIAEVEQEGATDRQALEVEEAEAHVEAAELELEAAFVEAGELPADEDEDEALPADEVNAQGLAEPIEVTVPPQIHEETAPRREAQRVSAFRRRRARR